MKGAWKDKRQWSQWNSSNAQSAVETHCRRGLLRLDQQLTAKPLMISDEVLTTSKEEQNCIWKEYCKELLSASDREIEKLCSSSQHMEHTHFNVICPDTPEIASAIDLLGTNKAIARAFNSRSHGERIFTVASHYTFFVW